MYIRTTNYISVTAQRNRFNLSIDLPIEGSIMGCRKKSICFASSLSIASLSVISPSLTISTAIRTPARAVRFPVRVCRMYSLPACTVNSMSYEHSIAHSRCNGYIIAVVCADGIIAV